MKQLFQLVAISLFGTNALEIIIVTGSLMLLLKMIISNFSDSIKSRKIRRQTREFENNVWAIE